MRLSFLFKSAILMGALSGLTLSSYALDNKSIKIVLIASSASKAAGAVNFTQLEGNKIKVEGKITGLTLGDHGMHIHTVGDCSDPDKGFLKSGGHFNPYSSNHGSLQNGHVGDLGNIVANVNGEAVFKFEVSKFNLIAKDKHSILSHALIVHASKDDEKTNPAGNSGARILCGVIELK